MVGTWVVAEPHGPLALGDVVADRGSIVAVGSRGWIPGDPLPRLRRQRIPAVLCVLPERVHPRSTARRVGPVPGPDAPEAPHTRQRHRAAASPYPGPVDVLARAWQIRLARPRLDGECECRRGPSLSSTHAEHLAFGEQGDHYKGNWSPLFEVDYGTPLNASCAEDSTKPGVFRRSWTKSEIEMDCNRWVGTITMTNGSVYA